MQTINVLSESVVRCTKGNELPGSPSPKTLYYWRMCGILNPRTGERHTLEWAYLGGAPVTSREAFERFAEKINEGRNGKSRGA